MAELANVDHVRQFHPFHPFKRLGGLGALGSLGASEACRGRIAMSAIAKEGSVTKACEVAEDRSTKTTNFCAECQREPRLGALTRCAGCIKAAADADRQTRAAAEARDDTRTRAAESARLEAQADAILTRDAQLMQELGQHVQALESCYRELLEPRTTLNTFVTWSDATKRSASRRTLQNASSIGLSAVGPRSWLCRLTQGTGRRVVKPRFGSVVYLRRRSATSKIRTTQVGLPIDRRRHLRNIPSVARSAAALNLRLAGQLAACSGAHICWLNILDSDAAISRL
jgi:hypothetical protein